MSRESIVRTALAASRGGLDFADALIAGVGRVTIEPMTADDVAVARQGEGMRPPAVLPRPLVLGLVVAVGATLATMGWLVGLFGLAYGFLPATAIGAVTVAGATILMAAKISRLGSVLFVLLAVPTLVILVLSRL